MSKLEESLALQLRALKMPVCEREFRFHPRRRWRLDFAWPELKIAAEVEGGCETHGMKRIVNGKVTTLKSRHLTVTGFREDCCKYNAAAALGWRVLRFSGAMIKSGEAIEQIEAVFRKVA